MSHRVSITIITDHNLLPNRRDVGLRWGGQCQGGDRYPEMYNRFQLHPRLDNVGNITITSITDIVGSPLRALCKKPYK